MDRAASAQRCSRGADAQQRPRLLQDRGQAGVHAGEAQARGVGAGLAPDGGPAVDPLPVKAVVVIIHVYRLRGRRVLEDDEGEAPELAALVVLHVEAGNLAKLREVGLHLLRRRRPRQPPHEDGLGVRAALRIGMTAGDGLVLKLLATEPADVLGHLPLLKGYKAKAPEVALVVALQLHPRNLAMLLEVGLDRCRRCGLGQAPDKNGPVHLLVQDAQQWRHPR
mmetsp:Transcript_37816/g.109013  ORF Transcript_37816/g.109013 Transcript_37816/m.109013 type:complete len:223 (-) Transcript_37816:119-787(-)